MDEQHRKAALARGLSGPWQSEPMLGSDYGEEEIEAAVAAIRSSMDPSVGFGFICDEIEQFEREFAAYCPTINFRSAPMSILGRGAKLVLCEADPDTLCADPDDVEKRITPHTRAILVTHMNGLCAPVDELLQIAERHPHPEHGPPKVIFDAARAGGGGYKGAKIGNQGWMTVFSFHTMKNMTTLGEGGAITTDDDDIIPRLHEIRQFGGEGWGSSYKMTKVQAAVGSVQLRKLDGLIAARRRLAHSRTEMLEGCPGLTLPSEPEGSFHSYYMYSILAPPDWAGEGRNRLIAILKERYGVNCGIFNEPVHTTIPFVQRHTQGQRLPISEQIGARLFCPAIHPTMSDDDNEYIAAAIWEAVEEIRTAG
jgi:perosamine synthetase